MNKDVKSLLKELTLEEKAGLLSGKDFWNLKGVERLDIPNIMVTDGPHGLRKQESEGDHVGLNDSVKATCFPTASATASSWDREIMTEMGKALAKECLAQDVSVILGPGVNIKRSPLCGRNFEYVSEDPYLAGEIATPLVNGIQSLGIGTSLKHFALNNQEYRRMITDSVCDERTMREIYLTGFEKVVKEAQPWTVMCGYNRVEGTYCSDNKKLLTDILKDEWGHKGLVVTDWGACNNRVEGVKAGLELEMPSSGGVNDKLVVEAINNGSLTMEELDKAVIRVLELILKSEENKKSGFKVDLNENNDLARRIASESAVLLKNSDSLLPLNSLENILVVGEFAKKQRYQGAGSSLINPVKITSATDELDSLGVKNIYKPGYSTTSDQPAEDLIADAVNAAKGAETVLVFAGLTDDYESEGFDRKHLDMPLSHNKLIEEIAKVNKRVVVVLQNGAPVTMPWLDSVSSVLESYLGGQASGAAAIDIISGKVNPSGKIAETFPAKLEDDLATKYFGIGKKTVEYREGLYVGYRYYDTSKKDVLFPFGHGLSYTSFTYSNVKVEKSKIKDTETLAVTVDITNSGSIKGKEIVQLYVEDCESTTHRPVKELKGFKKVELAPNETKTVEFILDKRSFAYYCEELNDWFVESGDFNILIGSSSRDIKESVKVSVESTTNYIEKDLKTKTPEFYNLVSTESISDETFKNCLGKEIPPLNMVKGEKFTMTSAVGDLIDTPEGKELYKSVLGIFINEDAEVKDDDTTKRMMEAMAFDMPLRSIILLSGGQFPKDKLEEVLDKINSNI